MQHYDYIFTGSGLSTLMTVYEMILSGKFQDKSILLIDQNQKTNNDRTWCFWDNSALYETIISKTWDKALFSNTTTKTQLNFAPYQYKMIKAIDYYNYVFKTILKQKNITFINEKVIHFEDLHNHCIVRTEKNHFECSKIFNSILDLEVVKSQTKYPLLQQHFVGWFIQSKEPVFDSGCATFMDFSVSQKGNTRFMYVLPTSPTEALIEYTLFSKNLLPKKEYEDEIVNYIKNLGIKDYHVIEKEQGNIPMTCYKFWKHNTKNIINIGSAGGWTKASTGFTFKNVTKKSRALTQFLTQEIDFRKFHKKDKFWLYDQLFIEVLFKENHLGSRIFSSLFKKGNPNLIFKFLDEETSYWEDLKVILKCPKIPFIKALISAVIRF